MLFTLVGGEADGRQIKLYKVMPAIEIPVMKPRPVTLMLPEPSIPDTIKTQTYRPKILENGEIIYNFCEEESECL